MMAADSRPSIITREDHLSGEHEALEYECRPSGDAPGCGPGQRVTAQYEGKQTLITSGPRAGQLGGSVSPVYRCAGCGRPIKGLELYAIRREREGRLL